MGQTLHFQRQLKSLEQRIQWLDKQLIPYETKLCPTCESINLKALTRWEQKNVRERRAQRYQELRELHRQAKAEGMTHKIWQTAGGTKVRASHRAANTQKVTIDEMFTVGEARLFLPSDPSAPLNETANCRCGVKYVRDNNDRVADIPRPVPKPTPPNRPHSVMFELKPGITIPESLMSPLISINSHYHRRTGKVFTVTSGPRNPLMQAAEMYKDRTDETYFRRLYVDDLADEIETVYQEAVKAEKSLIKIIKARAETIEAQIARGRYISLHLLGRGVDIRSRDMTAKEQEIFQEAASLYAKVLREGDHWHLEF